jgi:hypothetical protein
LERITGFFTGASPDLGQHRCRRFSGERIGGGVKRDEDRRRDEEG